MAIGEWLNGTPHVIDGTTLIPTLRSVGFASWQDTLGRIEYVDSEDPDISEFFVPRVIECIELEKKVKERRVRYFPEKNDGMGIALYLGIKLVKNGSIAIFCGTKPIVTSICAKAAEFIERGIPFKLPKDFSDNIEVERLHYLHVENLGQQASASMSAKHGIFSHHGNTPHGIRLAVEHAMRDDLVKFVVCTSTLAQGVNLPIRYLIVTSVYQGRERIKVRDFHNLIGRTGRSGMHTEGSILFADTSIYDTRNSMKENWRWNGVKELLNPANSEQCVSSLLKLTPLIIHNTRNCPLKLDTLSFARAYIGGWESLDEFIKETAEEYGTIGFTFEVVKEQVEFFSQAISSIEGFLLSNWDTTGNELSDASITDLAEQTLAYFLADEEQRKQIHELFMLLAKNIAENITDIDRRKSFGKTLYGVNDSKMIEQWVHDNAGALLNTQNEDELIDIAWELISAHVHHKDFSKFDKKDILKEIIKNWISGFPFHELFQIAEQNDCKIGMGKRPRHVTIDHIVNICENGIAYDAALLASAVCEFVGTLDQDGTDGLVNRLQLFQKQIKYGLPTETSIVLYELGFSDRVISQDIAESLSLSATQKKKLVKVLKQNRTEAMSVMEKYPSYFQERMNELL